MIRTPILKQVTEEWFCDKFLTKISFGEDCWEWTAGKNAVGYGTIVLPRTTKTVIATRVMRTWLDQEEIPPELVVRHTCDNRWCVRPDHLLVGTYRENTKDMMARNRWHSARAAQTHCKRGHPLSGDNLYVYNNMRRCRECQKHRGWVHDQKRRKRPIR